MAVALNPAAHRLRVVNAGHGPAVIRRRDGTIEDLTELSGIVLGVDEEAEYEEAETGLGPGDAVLIASDGISEATNPRQELYGHERLNEVVARTEGDAARLGAAVLEDGKAFTDMRALWDDATVVCFARSPA
jgi:sigma-B regulation protein RsbU (phosphoserine phosphatase)